MLALTQTMPISYPNNNVVKFLFVGRVMKEKGIDELFAAMGDCKEGQKFLDVVDRLKRIIRKAKECSPGWLIPWIPGECDSLIAACDCFVLPSYHEGWQTQFECASSGRPL